MAFDKARWIWNRENADADEFADFVCNFDGNGGDWKLNISADSDYNVYINGELAAFGQYADYPFYKIYDSIDVSDYVRRGNNLMVIKVWYYGIDTQTTASAEGEMHNPVKPPKQGAPFFIFSISRGLKLSFIRSGDFSSV